MSGVGVGRRGLCLVVAGPSGSGKSSVVRALRAREPELMMSVSATTRAPRRGEREGVDYHFLSEAEFAAQREAGAFLEWAQVLGRHCYGTPRAPVEAALAGGRDVVFDIDWQGYRSLRTVLPGDVVGVFLLPPSLDVLEGRLVQRAGEGAAEIARRMELAREEIRRCAEFDHVMVNDNFDRTVAEVGAVLHAARSSTSRLAGLAEFLAGLVLPAGQAP
jgi:guanylate kinase